jgi:hypothetical protein
MFEVCDGYLILGNEEPERMGEEAGVVSSPDVGQGLENFSVNAKNFVVQTEINAASYLGRRLPDMKWPRTVKFLNSVQSYTRITLNFTFTFTYTGIVLEKGRDPFHIVTRQPFLVIRLCLICFHVSASVIERPIF